MGYERKAGVGGFEEELNVERVGLEVLGGIDRE